MTGAARFLWFFRMGEEVFLCKYSSEKIVRKWIWKNEGAEKRKEKGGALRWEAGKMREELKKQLKKQGTSTGENEESVKIAEEKILDYGGE